MAGIAKKCRRIQQDLLLFVRGELATDQSQRVERHLSTCDVCSRALHDLELLEQELPSAASEPSEELRKVVHLAFRRVFAARQQASRRLGLARLRLHPAFQLGWGFALLVVGLLVGHWFWPRGETTPGPLSSYPDPALIAAVQRLEYDPASGQVTIVADVSERRVVRGRVDDPYISQVLSALIRENPNPGFRLRSVRVLAATQEHDPVVTRALLRAARSDENPGVRLRALRALRSLPATPEITSTLLYILQNDTNAALRIEAIDALTGSQDRSFAGLALRLAREDSNTYVRNQARRWIARLEDRPTGQVGR